jgi:hypothetical protein
MKLEDRFHSLQRTPAPPYWADVVDRATRPSVLQSPQPRAFERTSHRIRAGALAAVVALAGVGLVFKAFEPFGGNPPPASDQSSDTSALAAAPGYSMLWLCGGGIGGCPAGGVPESLWRPLRIPTLRPDGSCPASPAHRVVQLFGPALGEGPVYAVVHEGGVLRFEYPPDPNSVFAGSTWGGNKVLWFARPFYSGPVLVRGAEVGGTHEVGFSGGTSTAYSSLQFPPGQGWRNWPTATRLQAPGCYAYQVDGTNFSEVIVFRAVAVPP